jgi:hypothetical protein
VSRGCAGNPFCAVKVHPLAGARIDFPQDAIAILNGELADLLFVFSTADRFAALHARLQLTESGFGFVKIHRHRFSSLRLAQETTS